MYTGKKEWNKIQQIFQFVFAEQILKPWKLEKNTNNMYSTLFSLFAKTS